MLALRLEQAEDKNNPSNLLAPATSPLKSAKAAGETRTAHVVKPTVQKQKRRQAVESTVDTQTVKKAASANTGNVSKGTGRQLVSPVGVTPTRAKPVVGAKRPRVGGDDESKTVAIKPQKPAWVNSLAINPLQQKKPTRTLTTSDIMAGKARRRKVMSECLKGITCSREAVSKAKEQCMALAKDGHGSGVCDVRPPNFLLKWG